MPFDMRSMADDARSCITKKHLCSFLFCFFPCGICLEVVDYVVVACDNGICISQEESTNTDFGCTGWLSEENNWGNVTPHTRIAYWGTKVLNNIEFRVQEE